MSWEFRKVGPGENVAVEAQRDPFSAPKWAPPVWHMPEGLVLLVNAVRVVLRVVGFCLRYPLLVGSAAGAGWLAFRFGWQVPAVAAGLAAACLAVWAVAGWPSFVRWVARPVRARWRLWFTYGRHWQPVLVTAGLTKSHKGREYLPSIRRVRCGPASDRVLVQMLKGQAPAVWENATPNLAHGFGAVLVRVRQGTVDRWVWSGGRPLRRPMPKPGRIWLEFVRKDALKDPIPAIPIPEHPSAVDLEAIPIGRQEDGTVWLLRLLGTHVLIAGATGSGKGSVLWSLVRGLLPLMLAGLVEVWAIDPKRMELSFGRGLFERYGRYSSDPKGGMVELLESAAEDMNLRADQFAGVTRTFTPSAEHPFRVVIVDELAFLTAYCPDRDLRKRAEAAMATLATQGRSAGYCLIGAQQDARKEVNNLRNLFPDRVALRLDEEDQVDMMLGDGARDRGALADQISPIPQVGAGVGYKRLEGSPDPVRVRAAFVSDDDIRHMVNLAAPLDAGRAA